VFYFFERSNEFIRAEIDGNDETGYVIVVTDPDGRERTERYPTSEAVHARWVELQEQFQSDGWWGPAGRD
jgi:hypothetical protein